MSPATGALSFMRAPGPNFGRRYPIRGYGLDPMTSNGRRVASLADRLETIAGDLATIAATCDEEEDSDIGGSLLDMERSVRVTMRKLTRLAKSMDGRGI